MLVLVNKQEKLTEKSFDFSLDFLRLTMAEMEYEFNKKKTLILVHFANYQSKETGRGSHENSREK